MVIEQRARELFAKAYPWLGWPEGWRVEWRDDLPGACGSTTWDDKLILVCRTAARDNSRGHLADTLVHELTHMVCGPSVPHGRSFSARVRWAKKRAGVRWSRRK